MPTTPSATTALPPRYGAPISLTAAKKVMAAAEAEAARHHWPMVIAIVDSSSHLVMLHKLDQAQYGSVEIAQAKAETALKFRRPTKVFEDALAAGSVRVLSMANVAALEGGIPLLANGEVIGAIGVSGMHSSQDAQVAQAGAEAL
ncbi:MAG: heme-binding protein [Gammaproteobacteria bacterium]|nr:heme-binding protein [Gammaproteobacteria bacterium]